MNDNPDFAIRKGEPPLVPKEGTIRPSANPQGQIRRKSFRMGGLQIDRRIYAAVISLLTLGMYVFFLFLPAADLGVGREPFTGMEGLFACLILPALWPLAAAHGVFYLGVGALLSSRWRAAGICGTIAFAFGAYFGIPFLLSGGIGQIFKLAAMAMVAVGGFVGHRLYRPVRRRSPLRG